MVVHALLFSNGGAFFLRDVGALLFRDKLALLKCGADNRDLLLAALVLRGVVTLVIKDDIALAPGDEINLGVLDRVAHLLRLVPALLLRHCDHLGHLDQLTVLPDLLAALLLLDHAAIFPGHKIDDGIEDSVAHAVGDGQAPLLKDCVDDRLLNGVADGARLVPALLLQLRLAEWRRYAGESGRDSQQQQAQNHG